MEKRAFEVIVDRTEALEAVKRAVVGEGRWVDRRTGIEEVYEVRVFISGER